RVDIDRPILFHRSPVANLGGAVNDDIDAVQRSSDQVCIGQVAPMNGRAQFLEQRSIATRPRNRADAESSTDARFRDVPAYKARPAGDEIVFWHAGSILLHRQQ